MRIFIFILLNSLIISFASGQEKKLIRQGNASYKDKEYDNSELKYRKALEKNARSFDAGFNLGDALFRQKKYKEASKQFEQLAHSEATKENKAKAFHNLGNSYMMSKNEQQQPELQKAIDAYKNALRNNPKDDETRYNLAYAQKMLQKQQQQQKNNKNKDQKDQKNQDKKNQDNKDKKQDQKKDQKQNKDQKQDQQKNQKQQEKEKQSQKQQQIPKEKAEQMLKALENDEKDLQKKLKLQKVKGKKTNIEKDW